MTLSAKIGVFMDFWRFRAARHISRANCTEINSDRHWEAAHEIISIERKFQLSKSRFLGSRKSAHESIKERYLCKSPYFTVVSQSFVKMVADRHGHAEYHNKHWWRAFQSYQHRCLWMTLNFYNKGFLLTFVIFGCNAHSKNELDEIAGDRLTVCEQELL